MAQITMEMECGCFKRSGYDPVQKFATREEAIKRAEDMVEDMNESFCGLHRFSIDDSNDDIIIHVEKSF